MLQSVEIFGLQSSAPTLPLADGGAPGTDPVQIKRIDGLEPVKASISSTQNGSSDGETQTGASVGKRNIVMTFGLNPNWDDQTIASLRRLLYRYFMPKLPVRLVFTDSELPKCQIDGTVESMDPNIFSQDPEIQISILCMDPYFTAVVPTIFGGSVTDGTTTDTLAYEGTVETGFNLVIGLSPWGLDGTAVAELVVSSPLPQVMMVQGSVDNHINTPYFELSTVLGSKFIREVSQVDGQTIKMLALRTADSVWPLLYPGDNKISVAASNAAGIVTTTYSLKYYAKFGGL